MILSELSRDDSLSIRYSNATSLLSILDMFLRDWLLGLMSRANSSEGVPIRGRARHYGVFLLIRHFINAVKCLLLKCAPVL